MIHLNIFILKKKFIHIFLLFNHGKKYCFFMHFINFLSFIFDRYFCHYLIFILLTSCSHSNSDINNEDLDIQTETYDKDLKKADLSERDSKANRSSNSEKMQIFPRNAVTDWQRFFKNPPDPQQRKVMDQKIIFLKETQSSGEILKRAQLELATGKIQAAEATLRQYLRISEKKEEGLLLLATVYIRQKQTNDALKILSQLKDLILGSETNKPELILKYRYTLALGHLTQGDIYKAHGILSDLIGLNPGFTPAYVALATSYLNLGKDQVAEFVTRRALDRIKNSAELFNLMGLIAQKSGQDEIARNWFDKSLETNSYFAPALINRAITSAALLEYGAAEEDLVAAIKSDPNSADPYIVLASIQRKQGNFQGALASLTKALDIDALNPFARFNLAVLQVEDLKNQTEALRLFNEVLDTKQAPPDLRETTSKYINDLNYLQKI